MSNWKEVATLDEVPPGQMKRVEVESNELLIVNYEGKIYAIEDRCGHQKAPLSRGILSRTHVTCPLHGATFDVTTGANVSAPVYGPMPGWEKLPKEFTEVASKTMEIISKIKTESIKKFETRIDGDKIQVLLD